MMYNDNRSLKTVKRQLCTQDKDFRTFKKKISIGGERERKREKYILFIQIEE